MRSLYKTAFNPFSVRYDTLMKRWDQHEQLVQLEMQLLMGVDQMECVEKINLILNKFSEVGLFEDEQQRKWRRSGMLFLKGASHLSLGETLTSYIRVHL
jgi:hypothetical protein